MAGAAPLQPLPNWMSTTYLPEGIAGSSQLVTLVYPETYSGASIPGLTWPWVTPNANNPAAGTLVSVIGEDGGEGGLTRVGGTQEAGATGSAGAGVPGGSTGNGAQGGSAASVTPVQSLATVTSNNAYPSASSPTAQRPNASSVPAASASAIPYTSGGPSASPTALVPSSTSSVFASSVPSSSISSSIPSSSPSSTSSSATSSARTSSAPSDSGVFNQSRSLSGGATAGLVLGAIAGFLFLLLLLAAVLRRRRKRRNRGAGNGDNDPESDAFLGHDARNPQMVSRSGAAFLPVGAATTAQSTASPESQGLMSGYHPYNSHTSYQENDTIEALAGGEAPMAAMSSSSRTRNLSAATTGSSNPSHSTGGSTTTRGSLIAQFPTYRKPSDDSSPPSAGGRNGGHQNGTGGGGSNGATGNGSRKGDGSPATMASSDLFSAPPPRPPSRTRTVPGEVGPSSQVQSPQTSPVRELGLGRPPSMKILPRIPPPEFVDKPGESSHRRSESASAIPIVVSRRAASTSQQERSPGFIVSSREDYEQHLRNYQSAQRNGSDANSVGGWLGGFAFLRPYLGGNTPLPRSNSQRRAGREPSIAEGREPAIPSSTLPEEESEKQKEGALLLPSSTPLDRTAPSYRRVTTTAAAYSSADLEDLKRKPTIVCTKPSTGSRDNVSLPVGQATEGQSDDEEEEGEGDESRSFLEHDPDSTESAITAGAKAHLKGSQRQRWSRNTLGRPIRRISGISGISQISLSDARSISESIAGSVMAARSRSHSSSGKTRSRSNSNSTVSHAQSRREGSDGTTSTGANSLAVSRANSLAAQSHSSRSENGSGSVGSKGGQRRRDNSSNGSSAGSGGSHSNHGSRRSAKSEAISELEGARGRLRKVSEYGEVVPPPLPKPKALPLPGQA